MNQEIKAKWVAALRSGEYAQTKNCLRNDEGFCCLGVLCDIYAKDTETEWVPEKDNKPEFIFLDRIGTPPTQVQDWSGFPSRTGYLNDIKNRDGITEELTVLNDSGFTFNQIADVIQFAL
jgi:hypothetical protein